MSQVAEVPPPESGPVSKLESYANIEVRCFCSRSPLLAKAGRDKDGRPFVWMKVYKQRRLYGEMVAVEGEVHLRCRECRRWHRITIVSETSNLRVNGKNLASTG